MTETVTAEETVWEDEYITEEAFSTPTKAVLWGGFGILVVARLVIAILYVSYLNEFLAEANAMGAEVPGQLSAMLTFFIIETIGTLVFTTGLVVGGLVGNAPNWARVTLVSVAALVLIGSNALAGLFVGNMM